MRGQRPLYYRIDERLRYLERTQPLRSDQRLRGYAQRLQVSAQLGLTAQRRVVAHPAHALVCPALVEIELALPQACVV